MRKTKIVGTLGPATGDVEIIKSLIKAGLKMLQESIFHMGHMNHTQNL